MASPQFHQLPMFMSARQIMATHGPSRDEASQYDGASDSEIWHYKSAEAEDTRWQRFPDGTAESYSDNMLREGIRNPVTLGTEAAGRNDEGKLQVLHGHHRVAVMAKHRPDALIPVVHSDSAAHADLRDD